MAYQPHASDVLCGRGGLSNNHSGNRLFRRLVHHNKSAYQCTMSPSRKQILVLSIMESIHKRGGRFLRKEGTSWVEITRKEAAVKTSQALRETHDYGGGSDTASCSSSSTNSLAPKRKEPISKPNNPLTRLPKRTRPVSPLLPTNPLSILDQNLTPTKVLDCDDDFEPIAVNDYSSYYTFSALATVNHIDFEPIDICDAPNLGLAPELGRLIADIVGPQPFANRYSDIFAI